MGAILSVTVNGKVMQLKIKLANLYEPTILYAILNPMVASVEG